MLFFKKCTTLLYNNISAIKISEQKLLIKASNHKASLLFFRGFAKSIILFVCNENCFLKLACRHLRLTSYRFFRFLGFFWGKFLGFFGFFLGFLGFLDFLGFLGFLDFLDLGVLSTCTILIFIFNTISIFNSQLYSDLSIVNSILTCQNLLT